METSLGKIVIELDATRAPITVENFLGYVREGKYDNTLFHRVIPGFMIQGGGYLPGYKLVETRAPIKNESGNGLKNDKYAIAMARTPELDSATNQFFINTVDNPRLDSLKYAVFGRVVEGTDVVDRIEKVPTRPEPRIGDQPAPIEPVLIVTLRLAPAGEAGAAPPGGEKTEPGSGDRPQ